MKKMTKENVYTGFIGEPKAYFRLLAYAENAEEKKVPQRSESVDIKTGIELLYEQKKEAEGLLNNRPIQSQDHENWNNTTREYLIKCRR